MKIRFFFIVIICLGLYGSLSARLYAVQVKKGDYYTARALAREAGLLSTQTRRGQIYFTDRHATKIPVALNRDYPTVYAVPKELQDPRAAAQALGVLLHVDAETLTKAFLNTRLLYRLVKEKVTSEEISGIMALQIKGVYIGKRESRMYPFNSLGSRLLGFVGMKDDTEAPVGLYGIEKHFEEELRQGTDVYLTIDRNLQAEAEQVLAKLIGDYDAEQGSVIIAEPKTGRILAMSSLPDFNPNLYGTFPVERFTNPTVASVYEPGSVFKPITMAIGIETGAITPATAFVDTGSVTLNGKTIKNWDLKAHGRVTMTNVIEQSINVGTVYAESKIGHSRFLDYVKRFGFGQSTKIDSSDEARGSVKNLEKKDARDVDFATASFGQGTAMTPVQLVRAFGAIANGGVLMKPLLRSTEETKVEDRVVREETAKQVQVMMESAVTKARVAAIPHYRIAGKTGTAQIPDFRRGGYTEEYIHTFVGFGPVSDPKFLVLIKLDKPNVTLAGQTVVPAFKELTDYIISYYHIPPDALDVPAL